MTTCYGGLGGFYTGGSWGKPPKTWFPRLKKLADFAITHRRGRGRGKHNIGRMSGLGWRVFWRKMCPHRAWSWRNNDVNVAEKVPKMAFFGIFQTVGAGWTRVLPGCNWHQIAGNLVGILILGIFGGVTWLLVPLLWTKLGDTHFFGWQKRFFANNFWQGWNIGVKPTLNCGIWWGQQTKWGWFRLWAWHLRHSDVTKS